MSSVVVLGGGISGLAAAFYLSKVESSLIRQVTVIEASSRIGGWVQSKRFEDGSVCETGPRSIRGAGLPGYNTLELVEELGLSSRILPLTRGHPAASKRFIYCNSRLNALPNSLGSALSRQAPFTRPLAQVVLREAFRGRGKISDESVDSFFSRRFGSEVARYLADPLCRGVFAGNSRLLEMKSCFPAIQELEQDYGSVLVGMLRKPRVKGVPKSPLVNRMRSEKWTIWSLMNGLEEIPEAFGQFLSKQPSVRVQLNTACRSLAFKDGRAEIKTICDEEKRNITADHVISALPASALGKALSDQKQLSVLSNQLQGIQSASVAVVSLQFKTALPQLPQAFGHLIPSHESPGVLGVIYESCIFPQHNGRQCGTKLTVMLGGAWFEEAFGDVRTCNKDKITDTAIEAVSSQLNISEKPFRVVTNLLLNCIPQYRIGHSRNVEQIFNNIKTSRLPLTLIGSSYKGVSVNDCIYNARLAVDRLVGQIRNKQ